jgi:hypothetical protein
MSRRPSPRKASQFLSRAMAIVKERAGTHGNPVITHERIAMLWNAYLAICGFPGDQLTGSDAAMMLMLLKMARRRGAKRNADNMLDILGYGAIGAELTAREAAR